MVPSEFGHLPEYRGVTGTPPGSLWALLGLSGREEEAAKVGARPPSPIQIGMGADPPFLLSFSLFLLLLLQLGKGGDLLLLGVGIPLGARHREGRPSPPPLLYIRGQGAP